MGNDTLQLTRALVARPSITPDDAGCQRLLIDRLTPLGFTCESMPFNGVDNLWARHGRTHPVLCFAGHTDVVPTGPPEKWRSHPFRPEIRDNLLFGRGCADMKAGVAAFVTAAERYITEYPDHPGSIGLMITSDEEGLSIDGTVKVVEALRVRQETLDYCIVGEPTCSTRFGDTIKNGRRGSLSGRLVVKGKQGHIAHPHRAKNPIHLAAPAIVELSQTIWDGGNEYFPPTTWQISNVHAGTGATNVIPGEFEILFNFRYATASTIESLRARTHAILDGHGLDYELEWSLSAEPYLTPKGSLVAAATRAVSMATGIVPELSTSGGTSDGRFIASLCPQVIEFGHLHAGIHGIDECVAVEDIERLSEVYYQILVSLLGAREYR